MTTTPLEFPSQIDFVQFVSHYAHDLRSPFNRMMGFLKIVLKGQDGPLTDLQKEDLNTVYQNSVHSFMMIANLIDMSRLLLGEKSLNLTQTSLSGLFQQATSQWQKYHTDQNVQFETILPDDIAPMMVDNVLLTQAITGLVACAIECVKPPVKVVLAAEESPQGCLLTVRSTGQPALNPSHLDIDSYGYISKSIISLHGGELCQHETCDEGAVIQCVLPRT